MTRNRCVLAVVAVTLQGCAPRMIPPPEIYLDASFDPYEKLSPEDRSVHAKVFFATDRAPTGSTEPTRAYGSGRGGALRVGSATVRLGGASDDWDSLRASAAKGSRSGICLTGVEEIGKLWTTIPTSDDDFGAAVASIDDEHHAVREPAVRFAREIDEELARCSWPEIVIYVHGFNTRFDSAALLVAQLGHYMARDGAFLLYSWPSSSHPFGYAKDRESARLSARKLRELILYLAEHTDARRIHVLSYSAGAPVVTEALIQLRLLHANLGSHELAEVVRLGHVIYAGADEDLDTFRNLLLDDVDALASSITIYTSDIDRGLALSTGFATGSTRLGRGGAALTDREREGLARHELVKFVDVSEATRHKGTGDFFRHGYWFGNPWVSTDLMLTFLGFSPAERGLVSSEDGAVWEFPRDYAERLRGLVAEAEARAEDDG